MAETTNIVLIAGGTGFVGEAVRNAIRDSGRQVRLLVRSRDDAERMQELGFETAFGDSLDPQSLYAAMDGVDSVVNLVAIIKESGDATFERINFQGTANLVNAARQASVARLVQMSALGADNLPAFPYHHTKWRAENYVKDHIPEWTIIRPSIIFGPSSSDEVQFASQLADLVSSAPVIPLPGGGTARFQPIHTADVGGAFTAALTDDKYIGQTLEIGGPEVLTYAGMIDAIAEASHVNKPKIPVPVPLIRFGVRLLAPLPGVEAPVTAEQLDMLQLDNTTANNAAPELLGYAPKPFRGNLDFLKDYL